MTRPSKRLLPVLSVLLAAGFVVTSLTSFFVSMASLRHQVTGSALPITSDNVYSEIQRDLLRPVLISSVMASDTFLREWVLAGEQDQEAIQQYLGEIKTRYQTVTAFFVSETTQTYYHADGILKTVSPDEPRDTWYYRVRDMDQPYETNVDPDMANQDAMTIFCNYRVLDFQGNYIGATGVGLTVDAVRTLLDDLQSTYDRDVFFVDADGNVRLSATKATLPSNVFASEAYAGLEQGLIAGADASFDYRRGRDRIHVNVRYIPELQWYLVVEQAESPITADITRTLLTNLALCALITGVVLYLVRRATHAYQERIDTLRGIVPICSYCKKIRDDQGYWNQVEAYISHHTEAEFSHGICPECMREHYPELIDEGDAG